MLSVGSRDGTKALALGFCVGGEMEETELEEGEACDYQDDDTSIDPDVALSYIDEKLQDVLGHFQKDFEGGVSVENLGAKFGGYGSFLPTYQRSPSVWSHPRIPPKVQNYGTSRSPNSLPVEGADQNSTVPSIAPFSTKLGPASSSAAPPLVSRAPSVDNLVKRDAYCNGGAAGGFSPKHDPLNKSINPNDQKALKVRIRVGPQNTSFQKNAEIYSGLGLDMSPSSSLEGSIAESGGMSPESRESPDESLTIILQIMTSFPVHGDLLSPLPDSLLHLMEKEKLFRDSRSGPAHKGSQQSSGMLMDEPSSAKGDDKVLREKKMKILEKNGKSFEVKNGSSKDAANDSSPLLKKDIDIEISTDSDLGSKALKPPLLSGSKGTAGDIPKGAVPEIPRETNEGVVKEKVLFSDLAKEEALESVSSQDVSSVEKHNANMSSAYKVLEDKRASSLKDVLIDQKKDGSKGNKSIDICRADFDVSKGRRDPNGGPKQKSGQKATFCQQDGVKQPHGKEQPSSGCRRKSKGSQSNGTPAVEFPKERLGVSSSASLKDKKKSNHAGDYPSKSKLDDIKSQKESGKARESYRDLIGAFDYPSKSKLDDIKSQKESGKPRESYRDLIGDVKLEQAENRMDSLEMHSKDRQKDSKLQLFDKETHAFANKKERSSGKKDDNPWTSGAYPIVAPIVTPSMENGSVSGAAPATVASVIEENWVGCDKCQKWRLLPFGTEPKLPKKWLCSMLNWLPGMNRCDVSEEETTKALYALYQVPIIEGQNNMHSQPDGAASGIALAEVRQIDQNHRDHSLHSVHGSAKKKHVLKEASNIPTHMGSIHFSSSAKKNQHASVKSRSINDVNQYPLESNPNRPGFQHLSKSSDLAVGKHMSKQKEKHRSLEHYSDGGVTKHSNMKSKREADQNGFGDSKKFKTEGMYHTDEDWSSDIGVATGMVGPCSSSVLPAKAAGKGLHKYNDHFSSKDSKRDAMDSFPASVERLKDQVQISLDRGAPETEKCNKMDVAAKRRKEWQGSQNYLDPSSGHHLQDSRSSVKEETGEGEHRKEKKACMSKSEGKESSISKGDGRTDKKGKVTRILLSGNRDRLVDGMEEGISFIEKDQQLGQYQGGNNVSQQTLDGVDLLKRDLGYGQPSMAATSSSSKVSGSRKTKANFQEVKGSPVESVSSSPLKISNPDKVTSTKRNVLEKDDIMSFDVSVMGSPRRFSVGEGDQSNRFGKVKKEKAFSGIHHGYLESPVLDYQDKDVVQTLGGKGKQQIEPSLTEFDNTHLVNGDTDTLERHNWYQSEMQAKDHGHDEERVNNNHYCTNGSLSRKSGKGSSLRSKDKHRSSKSDFDKSKIKISDSFSEQERMFPMKGLRHEVEIEFRDRSPDHDEMRDGKYNFQEKFGVKFEKDEKIHSGKKDSVGKWSSESSRRENQSKYGGLEGSDLKLNAKCSKDGKSIPQQNLLPDHEGERSSNRILLDRIDKMDTALGRGNSQFVPHSGDKQETESWCPRPTPGSHVGSGSDVLPVDTSCVGDASKVPNHPRKFDHQNGACNNNWRHPTPNGLGARDLNAPSPARRDSSQAAGNNALKEAKDLKHSADRLKNTGSGLESTGLYFQAALKFLHAASLLEPCSNESARYVSVYSETAGLCEFCACEYERCKEMAAAALAYKCMEVAHMKVIYSKQSSAIKDRLELKNAVKVVPLGESPSSSASDIDNLNNQATLDKVALTKDSSSQVTGNHVIVARNRPTFEQLLGFANDVTLAMEASRKSQNAFAAANAGLDETQYGESISSVKRVLDFSFHDVEGLLRLVRLAMEVISH